MSKFDQLEMDLYYENKREENEDAPIDSLIDDLEYNDEFLTDYEEYLITSNKPDTSYNYKEFGYKWLIKNGVIYG